MTTPSKHNNDSRFSELLFESPYAADTERGERSRLLSLVLLVILPVLAATTLLVRYSLYPERGWVNPEFLLAASLTALMIVAFLLNRQGRYMPAAVLALFALLAAVFLSNHFTLSGAMEPTFSETDVNLVVYLVVPIILGAVLLPVRLLIVLVVACFAGVLLLPAFYDHIELMRVLGGPFQFLALVVALLVALTWYLTRYEHRRASSVIESEHRFRTLFEQSLVPIFLVDSTGLINDINGAASRVFGYTREALVGQPMTTVYADAAEWTAIVETVQQNGYVQQAPVKLRAHGGGLRDCRVTVWPRQADDGRVLEYQAITRDVTDELRSEEDRRLRGDLLELAFDPVFLVDPGGKIIYANQALASLTGYSKDELVGMNVRQLHVPEEVEEVPSLIGTMLREGGLGFEATYVSRTGERITLEIRTKAIETGERTLLLSVARDITRRKRDEAELRLRGELLDLAHDAVFLTDLKGRVVYANQAAATALGRTREEMSGLFVGDFAPAEDVSVMQSRIAELLEQDSISFETEHRRKDGRSVPTEVVSRLIEVDNEPLVLSVARDTSERKRAADELRRSEERYRLLAENTLEVIWRMDLDLRFTYVNPRIEPLTGFTVDEWVGTTLADHATPEHYKEMVQVVEHEMAHLATHDGAAFETAILHRDGHEIPVEIHGRIVTDEEGVPVALQGSTIDISERKRAEEELRSREKKYRELFEQSMDAVALTSPDGTLLEANQACLDLFGWSAEDIGNVNVRDLYVEPSARDEFVGRLNRDDRVPDEEVRFRRADGNEIIALRSGVARRDPSGRLISLQVVIRDVTEWKRAQRELEESELRFRTLAENTGVGILITRLTGEILDCNEAALGLFGYRRDESLKVNVRKLYARGSDREYVLEQFRRYGFLRGQEIEFKRKHGDPLYLLLTSARVPMNGEYVVMSELLDVTERRQAEAELRESRGRLQLLTMYLEDARERERTGIARELHDQLGQALTALRMDLNLLSAQAERGGSVPRERLEEMSRLVDQTAEDVRRISSELRPGMLDDIGLVAALEWQLTQWAIRNGIEYDFLPEYDDAGLEKATSTALFRVFQEILTNVTRHANASHIYVGFALEDGRAVLTVSDKGRGITEAEANHPESLGLMGMRERVRPLGGELEIAGTVGKGTTVRVSVPAA